MLTWETDHPLRVALPPTPRGAAAAFASVWTGWPRAALAGDANETLAVLMAVGGNGFVDQGTYHYASTGAQEMPVADLANWECI